LPQKLNFFDRSPVAAESECERLEAFYSIQCTIRRLALALVYSSDCRE